MSGRSGDQVTARRMVDVRSWAAHAWPEQDWDQAEVAHGAFHDVAMLRPRLVARVARGAGHRQRVERELAILDSMAPLTTSFSLPQPLSESVTYHQATGVLTTFVDGRARENASWAEVSEGFAYVLGVFSRASPERFGGLLPEPRAWCGGIEWGHIVRHRLASALPDAASTAAIDVVDDVLDLERGLTPGLLHGDLGMHNVLWHDGLVTGLIDLDHACWGDPAIDVAPLVGAFGARQIAGLVDAATLERAMRHRASLSLQVAAAAELAGDEAIRDHALRNFVSRLGAGTLYDPAGALPSQG